MPAGSISAPDVNAPPPDSSMYYPTMSSNSTTGVQYPFVIAPNGPAPSVPQQQNNQMFYPQVAMQGQPVNVAFPHMMTQQPVGGSIYGEPSMMQPQAQPVQIIYVQAPINPVALTPYTAQCCGCIPLRAGLITLAILMIVFGLYGVVFSRITWNVITGDIIGLLGGLIGLYGVFSSNILGLKIFCGFAILQGIWNVVDTIAYQIVNVYLILYTLIWVVLWFYWAYCIKQYYLTLIWQKGNNYLTSSIGSSGVNVVQPQPV